jgi:hypothetical protein
MADFNKCAFKLAAVSGKYSVFYKTDSFSIGRVGVSTDFACLLGGRYANTVSHPISQSKLLLLRKIYHSVFGATITDEKYAL